MLHSKLAIFGFVCLLGVDAAGSAHAQEYATEWSGGSVINLGRFQPDGSSSNATSINDAGQVVGDSDSGATEWSNGQTINLLGTDSLAEGINNAGQVVGQASSPTPPATLTTRPSGAMAKSSTWEARGALQAASTIQGRWRERAGS
jgi:uncharacterized membrane protein